MHRPKAEASSEQHQRKLPVVSEAPMPSSVQSQPNRVLAHFDGFIIVVVIVVCRVVHHHH